MAATRAHGSLLWRRLSRGVTSGKPWMVRQCSSVSTSFVRWGRSAVTPPTRRRGGRLFPEPGAGRWRGGRLTSQGRVRAVADPKGRCPGSGRPRWIAESPPSALPNPPDRSSACPRRRQRSAACRPRRTGVVSHSALPPSRSGSAGTAGCTGRAASPTGLRAWATLDRGQGRCASRRVTRDRPPAGAGLGPRPGPARNNPRQVGEETRAPPQPQDPWQRSGSRACRQVRGSIVDGGGRGGGHRRGYPEELGLGGWELAVGADRAGAVLLRASRRRDRSGPPRGPPRWSRPGRSCVTRTTSCVTAGGWSPRSPRNRRTAGTSPATPPERPATAARSCTCTPGGHLPLLRSARRGEHARGVAGGRAIPPWRGRLEA
jgi:hypothetical protein